VTNPNRTPGMLGRLPNDPTKPRLRLIQHLDTAVPPNPAVVDWMSKVLSWPMYGNDRYGDCVFAMAGHAIEAWTTYSEGSTTTVTDADVLKGYHDVTGFNPNDPATDQGAAVQAALNYWRTTGIGGHKIVAFAQVDHHNPAEVQAALNVFGTLLVGINFPASAMTQFNNGLPWDAVPNDGGIEGGHAIHVGGYNQPRDQYTATTWGQPQIMNAEFWHTYVDEAWVAITPDWLSTAGLTPEGVDLHGLGEDFAQLTGQPNPFPTPVPPAPTPAPPTPVPGPTPPAPNAVDVAFAGVLRPWATHHHIGANKVAADAAKAWLFAKNL
jgi:hypothetical protein